MKSLLKIVLVSVFFLSIVTSCDTENSDEFIPSSPENSIKIDDQKHTEGGTEPEDPGKM